MAPLLSIEKRGLENLYPLLLLAKRKEGGAQFCEPIEHRNSLRSLLALLGKIGMKGFYLYCIKEKNGGGRSLGNGIDKKGQVYIIDYKELEAVISDVPLEEFDSEELQKKAQENLKWIKEKAELHEKIIERAMGKEKKIPVIPMKFGTIFKDIEKLNSILKKNYAKFKKILKRLKGKQEWGVKIYLKDPAALREEIRKQNPEVQSLKASLDSLPEGVAYFKGKEIEELIDSKLKEILDSHKEFFFSNLKKYAVSSNRGKTLEKELTGSPYKMILNAIFLVPEKKLSDFKTRIKELSQEAGPKGFYFEYSGPWPPYNFV